ncbi:MAG: hypothetical protein GY940_38745, partial [bacterium]|nr:hypothetical protein [bacterium]
YATVKEKDLIPEGTAYDDNTGTFYISSIYKRKIVAIDKNGKTRDFIQREQDGIWSTLGMDIDESRNMLWVVSANINSVAPMLNPEPANEWKSKLYKYDLSSKKLVRTFDCPAAVKKSCFNDLVVSKNGTVYITESVNAAVYRIAPGQSSIEPFYREKGARAFYNGPTLNQDETYL